MEELNELVGGHIKELIKIDAMKIELLERPLWLATRNIGFNDRLIQAMKERFR